MDDVLDLPFPDASFDVIWSKHLLQWVSERTPVLAEFVRVSKPGGRIICCNFDGFFLSHFPTNPKVQQDVERWALQANAEFGFDNNLARKLPSMFKQVGLTNIKVNTMADKAFSGCAGMKKERGTGKHNGKVHCPSAHASSVASALPKKRRVEFSKPSMVQTYSFTQLCFMLKEQYRKI